jgi:hypothetical protein
MPRPEGVSLLNQFTESLSNSHASTYYRQPHMTPASETRLDTKNMSAPSHRTWFSKGDSTDANVSTWRKWKNRRKFTLWSCFATIFAVFLTNLVVATVAWKRLPKTTSDTYVRGVYSGKCNTVKNAGIGAHVVINILGTLMLGASNLCMQLISAPSRKEINRAHARGIWLDIGVPSFRNLRHIPKRSVVVWCILALTSIPIHFL